MTDAPNGSQWQHVKRGTFYKVLTDAELQTVSGDLVDGSTLVIYQGDDGKVWAREEGEFHDGRFVSVPEDRMKTAPTNAATAGWVLVPVEPTEAMLDAFFCRCRENKGMRAYLFGQMRGDWAAMLAAAPTPPALSSTDGLTREDGEQFAENAKNLPAGMKPWAGGDRPPYDWDGGPVRLRNGAVSHYPQRWSVGYPGDICNHPTGTDIIAYTPLPSSPALLVDHQRPWSSDNPPREKMGEGAILDHQRPWSSNNEIADIAAKLTKVPRRLQWFKSIAQAGPEGLDNTRMPWVHIANLRRAGLSRPIFRSPFYYETITSLGLAVSTLIAQTEER